MAAKARIPAVSPASTIDVLLTIQDGCTKLRVGKTKMWQLIGDGRLEVVRLGSRSTRIKASSLDRLIANGL